MIAMGLYTSFCFILQWFASYFVILFVDWFPSHRKAVGWVDCFCFLLWLPCTCIYHILSELKIFNLVLLYYNLMLFVKSQICYELHSLNITALNVREGKYLSFREEFFYMFFLNFCVIECDNGKHLLFS